MPFDHLADEPPEGLWPQWFWGVAVPVVLAVYALSVLVTGEGILPGRGGRLVLNGLDAMVYGVGLLGVSSFLHWHFFWGNTRKLAQYSPLGRLIAAVVVVAALTVLVVRVLLLG